MEKGEVMRGILSMAAPWLLFDAAALLVAFVITVMAQFYAYLTPEHDIPTDSHTEDE